MKIAATVMAVRARLRHEQEQRVHFRVVPSLRKQIYRVDWPIYPQIIGIHGQKRGVSELVSRLDHASARLEQHRALIRHGNVQVVSIAFEVRFQRIREIMDVDHHVADARRTQAIEAMVD